MDADILGSEHCDALNQCLRENSRCSEIIRRAKEAGLPMEDFEADCAQKLKIATGLKRQFFPNAP